MLRSTTVIPAAGGLDGCFGLEAKLWDVAAGFLIVAEAGGTGSQLGGAPIFPIDPRTYQGQDLEFLAAGPRLHAMLVGQRAPGTSETVDHDKKEKHT